MQFHIISLFLNKVIITVNLRVERIPSLPYCIEAYPQHGREIELSQLHSGQSAESIDVLKRSKTTFGSSLTAFRSQLHPCSESSQLSSSFILYIKLD